MIRTKELRTQTLELVRALEPEQLSGDDAAAVVRDLAVIEKAAATGRMFAAVRVAKTDAWRGQGHASAADWLAAQAGITVREAAAQLGTAKKVDRLGRTKAQMQAGRLSPGQAGAVADAATADPGAEERLLDTAEKDTTAKLKDEAARTKAAATDSATRERRIHAERSVRIRTDHDGAFTLALRGPGADGVRLQAMMRPFEEQAFRTGRQDGIRDTFENRSYDAFQALLAQLRTGIAPSDVATCEPASADRAPAGSHGDGPAPAGPAGPGTAAGAQPTAPPGPGRATGGRVADTGQGKPDAAWTPADRGCSDRDRPAEDRSMSRSSPGPAPGPTQPAGGNNVKVIVRIDHTALIRGHTVAGETCDVAGLGPISVEAVRDLMRDDPFLAAVVTKGRDVLTVAHLGRGLNAHQRTALEALGLRCSNRACNRTVALQIDHRVPYAQVPETKLDNQDPLCPDCHQRKTHHGWHLEPGTGPRRFLPPDTETDHARDRPVPERPDQPRGPARPSSRGLPPSDPVEPSLFAVAGQIPGADQKYEPRRRGSSGGPPGVDPGTAAGGAPAGVSAPARSGGGGGGA